MTINTDKLGWLVAGALAFAVVGGALSGFQANTMPKFANVDMIRVYNDSPLATTNSAALEDARKARGAVLEFINRNRAMDTNDARKFAEFSLKAAPTADDKKEIARLQKAGEDATTERAALSLKNPPTDADRAKIADFGSKVTANNALLQTLQGQYETDLQTMTGDLRDKTLARVREVVKSIAAKGGYTVVFDANSAPFAANDLTDEAMKALKK